MLWFNAQQGDLLRYNVIVYYVIVDAGNTMMAAVSQQGHVLLALPGSAQPGTNSSTQSGSKATSGHWSHISYSIRF